MKADVVIIGAGLMGSSTALFLARAGKKVLLLEKEKSAYHASAVNAGGVRQLNRALPEIPISAAAMEMWPRLSEWVGDDCGFQAVGQVRIATDQDAMTLFEKRIAEVRALGFSHEELVDAQEIKRLVPAFSGPCQGGMVSHADGLALPARALKAFFNTACSAGVQPFTACEVRQISHDGDGFTVQAADGRCFSSEVVINCAGAWGAKIAAMFDENLPLAPTGLSMMVTARVPRFLKPVIGVQGRKLSFKQMENGTVVIGGAHRAFLDMQAEKTTLDFSKMKESADTVTEFFPVMQHAKVVRCWAGIEGIMSDGLPVIGESEKIPGLFHVCGFSAHGFQLSPMVGRLVAALVQGHQPEISLEPFCTGRFRDENAPKCRIDPNMELV